MFLRGSGPRRIMLGVVIGVVLVLASVEHAGAGLGQWTTGGPIGFYGLRRVAVDPTTPATVYAAGGDGVIKSTDGGAHWGAPSYEPYGSVWALTVAPQTPVVLAVDPQTPTTLYAGTWLQGVFKSTDGGGVWSRSDSGVTGGILLDSALVVHPRVPTTLYLTSRARTGASCGV